jgi:hypothetical protein
MKMLLIVAVLLMLTSAANAEPWTLCASVIGP